MPAYEPDAWHEFFIGSAGGVAALSGLIFVAVSVNLREIFAAEKEEGGRFLTGRAIEALVALLLALVISMVGLAPEIAPWVLGTFVLLAAAASAISPLRMIVTARSARSRQKGGASRLVMATAFFVVLLVAGISIIVQAGGGLYWLPVAFVIGVMVAAVNAWVLLVEVLR
ncbi:hypothetical protein GCM10022286_02850 [Gryllotalpicola daejeonensis]|uniref:Uncharacterized protein n=1 Tax=Gryllotalpicola daejeonensis TaxID=993087 RepID=A0ABP7ZDZ8_9MICO